MNMIRGDSRGIRKTAILYRQREDPLRRQIIRKIKTAAHSLTLKQWFIVEWAKSMIYHKKDTTQSLIIVEKAF